ncbi:MAG TPA: carboxypeptidase-like regulatory domain-containing protein [Vicinamibacterales bacterium]|jgi:hypothetical protein|nr:carboxypeptidase-like regulatory domain-containing protein [Vicinamibacterales bacterium]
MSFTKRFVGVLVVLLTLHIPAFAQGTADITGRVADSSGGVLPGVTVTATNLGTNVSRTTVTTDTGDYTFTALLIGTYEVKGELTGFGTQTSKVELRAGDRIRVDMKLAVGTLAESVTVSGGAPLLQTDTSRVSSSLSLETVQNTPIQGRNIMNLVQMSPGASEGSALATLSGNRPDDRRQTSATSINGAPENNNSNMVDGMDNTERVMGGMGIKPSIDAIQEVVIQTNMYSAEFGRTEAGVINIITKSGGNQVHGSGFYYGRNQATDSKPYFAPTNPPHTLNQFGGSIGGPIKENRTFYFADYDNGRETKYRPTVTTVPTMKMRTGDFSELLNLPTPVVIYDPLSGPGARTPFPGNIIPANRLDPWAMYLMHLYPLPNAAGSLNGTAGNNAFNGPGWQHNQEGDFRVDHKFSAQNSIFARVSGNLTNGVAADECAHATVNGPWNWSTMSPGTETRTIDPTCDLNGGVGILSGPYHSYAWNVVANWTRVQSSTLVTELKYSVTRPSTAANRPPENAADLGTWLGFRGVNNSADPVTNGMPFFQMLPIATYSGLGDPLFIPMVTEDHNHEIAGTVTKLKGAHSLKVGAGFVWRLFAVQQSQSPRSTWLFDPSPTNNGSGGGGNTFASFLLGYPQSESRTDFPIHPLNRNQEPRAFINDDWRATSWLTLNLGLRWEAYTPITEAQNRIAAFRLLPNGSYGMQVATPSDPTVGVKTDWNDWGPRLGFSATAPSRIVVRGGFGITYNPVQHGAGSMMKNPPFVQNFGPLTSSATSGGAKPTLFLEDIPPPYTYGDPSAPVGPLGAQSLNLKMLRSKQFNLFVEKQLGENVLSAGYIGERIDHVALSVNINLPPIGPGSVNPRRPFFSQFPLVTNITDIQSIGQKTYNGLQLMFRRNLSRGLTFQTHYTLAEARASTIEPWTMSTLEWGDIPTYDIRHHWVGILNYNLPSGNDLHGIVHGLLAGWQVNANANIQSGLDFGITNSAAQTNVGGSDRPNLIGNPNLPSNQRTVQQWFNTAAFQIQAPLTPGNTPPGSMHGPWQRRIDLSLGKALLQQGTRSIQLRIECYNIMNWVNFQPPDGTFGATTFGTLFSTGNAVPRQFQFGMRYLF